MIEFTSFLVILSPPVVNRMLAARNVKQMQRSFSAFVVFRFLLLLLLLVIGFGVLLHHGPAKIKENMAFATIAQTLFAGNPWIVLLLFVMLLAVAMSTADSFLNSMVVVIIRDLVRPWRKTEPSEKKEMQLVPYLALGGGLASILLALALKGVRIVTLVNLMQRLLALFVAPLLLFAWGLKRNKKVFWGSVVIFLFSLGLFSLLTAHNLIWVDALADWKKLIFRRKFYVAVVLALAVTLPLTLLYHMLVHRGLRFEEALPRSMYYPSQNKTKGAWRDFFVHPVQWADQQMFHYGALPVGVALFLSIASLLPELTAPQPSQGNAPIYLAVRFLALLLCCGLLLQESWVDALRKYFGLYYYASLAYTIPFIYSLAFFYNPNNPTNLIGLFMAMTLLILLVDTKTFFALQIVGSLLAWGVARLSPVAMPMSTTTRWYLVVAVVYAFLLALLFGRLKWRVMKQKLFRQRTWTNGMVHDVQEDCIHSTLRASELLELLGAHLQETKKNGKTYQTLSLEKKVFDKKVYLPLKKIQQESDRSAHQIKQFILLNQKEHESVAVEKGPLLPALELTLAHLSEKYRKLVKVKVPKDFVVAFHPALLHHVLYNLVKNASMHGHATEVEIGVTPQGELYVKDNGDGIPPHARPYVFELYRSKNSTGVGLAFVLQLMEMMGGTLSFKSSPEGTTFFLRFSKR